MRHTDFAGTSKKRDKGKGKGKGKRRALCWYRGSREEATNLQEGKRGAGPAIYRNYSYATFAHIVAGRFGNYAHCASEGHPVALREELSRRESVNVPK